MDIDVTRKRLRQFLEEVLGEKHTRVRMVFTDSRWESTSASYEAPLYRCFSVSFHVCEAGGFTVGLELNTPEQIIDKMGAIVQDINNALLTAKEEKK